MTLQIILLKGAPSSGKSTWAKAEVAKDPLRYLRINNDLIREMCNGSVFSSGYEKMITSIRNSMIQEGIDRDLNIIIDNVNSNKQHFKTVCSIAEKANKDITVSEMAFYEPLEVLLERDGKREGKARVGEQVVRKFFNDLGRDQFKNYQAKTQTFAKRSFTLDKEFSPMKQDENKPKCLISDVDGTLLTIGNRSPFDASKSDILDIPKYETIEAIKLYYKAGYKIVFCSGRMAKDQPPTRRFIDKHFPNMEYELFTRADGDQRKDSIIKEEIFNAHIKPRYNCRLIIDDRNQVVNQWRLMGLICWQVADGDF